MYQTTIRLRRPLDPRVIHRTIEHDTHPGRALWAQPTPRTLIVRTTQDVALTGFPDAAAVSTSMVRTRYPAGQAVSWALVANATRAEPAPGPPGQRPRGRRVGITDPADAERWVRRRLADALSVRDVQCERATPVQGAGGLTLTRWAYAGTGVVADPEVLARLLAEGVGRGKAFGCGMLLIAEQQSREVAA